MMRTLAVDVIETSLGTQMRAKVDDDVVEHYAELWKQKHEFPPLDVFDDGERLILADGFHRLYGAQAAKRASIKCEVHKGTLRDAILFACGANHQHGLHRSRKDKRIAVETLLDDPEWGKRSARWIADQCQVSDTFVLMIRAERNHSTANVGGRNSIEKVETKDGKQRAATTSAKSKPADSPANPSEPTPPLPPEGTVSQTDQGSQGEGESGGKQLGKCPNCAGTKWDSDDLGISCAKCGHPHGEPAGDVDEDRIGDQRAKTVKTVEALMRAFDDLNHLCRHPKEHANAIAQCKFLLKEAREWK